MAAVKINFSALKLRPDTLASLNAFRRRHADLVKTLNELKEQSTSVDFDYYRKLLANKKVVDDAERAFKAFAPASYNVTEQLRIVQQQESKA
ncbi:ATP synthase d subunit, partial [Cladochytrium tenue]